MFSIDDRNRIHDRVLQLAASDTRVVAGAVVGSLAHDEGDRWSDLDLTFAVVDTLPLQEVLTESALDRGFELPPTLVDARPDNHDLYSGDWFRV